MLNAGPHGLSEVLYAFTSPANNNGIAFAGLTANTAFYNIALGLAMLVGPVPADALRAGAWPARSPGSDPSRRPRARCPPTGRCSSALLVGVVVIVVGSHLLPGPRAGTARGRTHTDDHARRAAPAVPRHRAGSAPDSSTHGCCVTQLPAALRASSTRADGAQPGDVRRRGGRGAHAPSLAIADPIGLRLARSRCGCGSPWCSPTWPRPWPRAGARPRPTRCASRARRPSASLVGRRRAPRSRRRAELTVGDRGRRRGRRRDPRRRRRHRGHRQRRRVGHHRRVRARHPGVRRRPVGGHRRHAGALGPDRRPDHREARARPSSTG